MISTMVGQAQSVERLTAEQPGGGHESIFAGYVPLASQKPYSTIVYSVANYGLHLCHFLANAIRT